MATTTISWTAGDDGTKGGSWNPSTGCDWNSEGCDNCYARTMAKRLKAMGQAKYQTDGDPRTSGPGFGVATHDDALTQPLTWRKPKRVFVNSMSDLFHARIPAEFIARAFVVMALAEQHTFQILTKRPKRMRDLLTSTRWRELLQEADAWACTLDLPIPVERFLAVRKWIYGTGDWQRPVDALSNVWLGTSVELQASADIRIPLLIDTPAFVRFLSCEPLLGPVDLTAIRPPSPVGLRLWGIDALDWVIVGGESGARARRMSPEWARQLRNQCVDAGVPFHFKQLGVVLARELGVKGNGEDFDTLPTEFQLRQYPDLAGVR